MDMILGGLAFMALIVSQFASVVAVHSERKNTEAAIAPLPPHTDHRTRLIWEGGY